MGRALTPDEIPKVLAATNERIEHFVAGFVRIEGDEDDASLLGSGTLVTFSGRYAILTADHVLEVLPKNGKIGLVLPIGGPTPKLHRFILDAAKAQQLHVARASHNCNGPDLGLLLLASADANRLAQVRTFYNLANRRERMLSKPPPIDLGGWFLVGMGAEWTADLPLEHGFTRVKAFRGLTGAGVVASERRIGDYDYLDFEAKYEAGYQGPQSFRGFSGGGLWQIHLKETNGKPELVDTLLSGVAFYESEMKGELRTIFCHGRFSIYEHVCNALANVAAS